MTWPVVIRQVATLFDDDGIMVRFMNNMTEGNGIRDAAAANALLGQVCSCVACLTFLHYSLRCDMIRLRCRWPLNHERKIQPPAMLWSQPRVHCLQVQYNGLTPLGTNLNNKVIQPFLASGVNGRNLAKPILVRMDLSYSCYKSCWLFALRCRCDCNRAAYGSFGIHARKTICPFLERAAQTTRRSSSSRTASRPASPATPSPT